METEITYIKEDRVACAGNDLSMGHPRIFLDLTKTHQVICPYCSRTFVRA
jgi:uncharacterized Zn-finger protein